MRLLHNLKGQWRGVVLAYSVSFVMEERICPILVNGEPKKKLYIL
jgi:hypothetical protein